MATRSPLPRSRATRSIPVSPRPSRPAQSDHAQTSSKSYPAACPSLKNASQNSSKRRPLRGKRLRRFVELLKELAESCHRLLFAAWRRGVSHPALSTVAGEWLSAMRADRIIGSVYQDRGTCITTDVTEPCKSGVWALRWIGGQQGLPWWSNSRTSQGSTAAEAADLRCPRHRPGRRQPIPVLLAQLCGKGVRHPLCRRSS